MNTAETPLLTPDEVSAMLQLTKRCLKEWRVKKKHLPFIRISQHCVRYKLSDVQAFIESKTQGNQL